MSEGIGRIGDVRTLAQFGCHPTAFEKIANVGLAARDQRVGLDVPGTDGDPACMTGSFQPFALIRADGEVVLDHDGLPVELETVLRVGIDEFEDSIDGVDQARAKRLERLVPFAVPVRMRDEDALHDDPGKYID